jgi:hypothetical protein
MRFGPEAVRHVLDLLEAEPVAPEEPARLAALTGSWEELLAHLLLRRESFGACPEIVTAIRQQSAAYRGGPASRRAEVDDLLRLEETAGELEAALALLLAAEAEREAAADRVADAWRTHVGARRPVGFDLHLRLATEKRG